MYLMANMYIWPTGTLWHATVGPLSLWRGWTCWAGLGDDGSQMACTQISVASCWTGTLQIWSHWSIIWWGLKVQYSWRVEGLDECKHYEDWCQMTIRIIWKDFYRLPQTASVQYCTSWRYCDGPYLVLPRKNRHSQPAPVHLLAGWALRCGNDWESNIQYVKGIFNAILAVRATLQRWGNHSASKGKSKENNY